MFLLAGDELCVCELMNVLKMSQSRISNHLRILKNTGVIEARKEGKWIFYSLAKDRMDTSAFSIIQNIAKKIEEEGYFAREKRTVQSLIPLRGKSGHCPLPHIEENL